MSKDLHIMDTIRESPKESGKPSPLDLNTLEMVFGTPKAPKSDLRPDTHLITSEKKHAIEPHNNNRGDLSDVVPSSQPLLEPDKGQPNPPLAGPEIDDLDDADGSHHLAPYPGIDDGLLEPGDHKDEKPNEHGEEDKSGDGTHHPDDGKWHWPEVGSDEADYPTYDMNGFGGLGPRFGIDDRPGSPMIPGSIPDVNTYQQKKNLAQGMMDLALLSANANQLRYVLESSTSHPYYYPSLAFISLSIILQIAVGVGLIMNSRYNVKDDKDICKADKINNMTVLGVFLITIVNVFITSFSVASPQVNVAVATTAVQQAG